MASDTIKRVERADGCSGLRRVRSPQAQGAARAGRYFCPLRRSLADHPGDAPVGADQRHGVAFRARDVRVHEEVLELLRLGQAERMEAVAAPPPA